ncbi:MAG: hypothetical protein R6W78_15490 [Bacteroidales bacterium]
MKTLFILFVGIILFVSCKKEKYGNVKQEIKCTSGKLTTKNVKSMKSSQELKYVQFGDFITSLTPVSFVGELSVVRFHAENDDFSSKMTLVMRQSYFGEDPVYADFSNNSTISVVPELNGDMMTNPDGQGGFFRNPVTFKMLWIDMGLSLSLELPVEYTHVTLNQFNYPSELSKKNGRILTTTLTPLNQIVSELAELGSTINFVFGLSDSTYISKDSFLAVPAYPHVRSSKYTQWIMSPPLEDEVKTYVSTIEFINDDIIQIYAGADNIPYTSDDIIVLEPKFWERINVYVDERTE